MNVVLASGQSYNSLEQLSAGFIATNLTRLLNLDLSHNRLESIDSNIFSMIPALSHLKPNDNRLINIGDYMRFMPIRVPRTELQLEMSFQVLRRSLVTFECLNLFNRLLCF